MATYRLNQRDVARLTWFFNDAHGELGGLQAQGYGRNSGSEGGWAPWMDEGPSLVDEIDFACRRRDALLLEGVRAAMRRAGEGVHWDVLARMFGPRRRSDPYADFYDLAPLVKLTKAVHERAMRLYPRARLAELEQIHLGHLRARRGQSAMHVAALVFEADARLPTHPTHETLLALIDQVFEAATRKASRDGTFLAMVRDEARTLYAGAQHAFVETRRAVEQLAVWGHEDRL
jgi:hypothetical protein